MSGAANKLPVEQVEVSPVFSGPQGPDLTPGLLGLRVDAYNEYGKVAEVLLPPEIAKQLFGRLGDTLEKAGLHS